MAIPSGFKEQEQGDYWTPEVEGENLQGKITAIKDGDFGKQWLITLADGKSLWTPSHKFLQNRMQNMPLQSTVYIEFVKTELPKVKGHNPTRIYLVASKE